MKLLKLITLMLLMNCVTSLYSQSGQPQYFNYKAIIKDDNGNVVANTQITVQFSIIRQILMATSYTETHTPTTDDNGIINLTIGQGNTTFGAWNNINWSVLSHYLNVKINIGNGLKDMGTTIFRSVPYAIHAQISDVALNTSLKEIHNQGNTGWRLRSEANVTHVNTGQNALDLSFSTGFNLNSNGAAGDYSFASGNNTRSAGDHSVAMGFGSSAFGLCSTSIGINNRASGDYSVAMGVLAEATGYGTVAIGSGTFAEGNHSTSFGFFTEALGNYSTSLGNYTTALGDYSTSLGEYTTALGNYSTSLGEFTIANSLNSLAIGRYNIGGGHRTNWVRTNKLFEIGNGSAGYLSNAFTVFVGTDASLTNNSGYVMIGNNSSKNILFDTNEIMARNNGYASTLYLNQNGGAVAVNGAIVHASDRRLKQDIETIQYGLDEILNINPKQYNWKKSPNQTSKSLGVIAQEIQKIIPNMVHVSDDDKKSLSVNYTALIPVLIKAIQEQQKIIESQNNKVTVLTTKVDKYKSLENRLNTLEILLNIEMNNAKTN